MGVGETRRVVGQRRVGAGRRRVGAGWRGVASAELVLGTRTRTHPASRVVAEGAVEVERVKVVVASDVRSVLVVEVVVAARVRGVLEVLGRVLEVLVPRPEAKDEDGGGKVRQLEEVAVEKVGGDLARVELGGDPAEGADHGEARVLDLRLHVEVQELVGGRVAQRVEAVVARVRAVKHGRTGLALLHLRLERRQGRELRELHVVAAGGTSNVSGRERA